MRQWMMNMWGKMNNRKTWVSLLAIGAITAIGATRRRGKMNNNKWRQWTMFRKLVKM